MSKVAELKADIPETGNGIIINVYSSIEDMSNEYYTNDYILVEAEYDGEYHKNCPIAVTYSRNSDAFNEFGTEWTLTDADGKTCYVMTEPYFPHECIVTYESPVITLCYDNSCLKEITMKCNDSIAPIAKPTYTLHWTDSCGNSGDEIGELEYSLIIFHLSESLLQYELDSSTGEFTVESDVAKDGGGTYSVGFIYARASINGVNGTSASIYIMMEYLDLKANFYDVNVWVWHKEGRGLQKSYNVLPQYVAYGGFYYFNQPNKWYYIHSYDSYEDAIDAGQTGSTDPDVNTGDGYFVLSIPNYSDLLFFTIEGYDGIFTCEVGGSYIDLSDGTGDLG